MPLVAPLDQPPLTGLAIKVRRMPGHYVEQGEPVIDIQLGSHILTLCAPVHGKIMRCSEVGAQIPPGAEVIEVTEIGTKTWEVFVSYRWADSSGHAGRVADRLRQDLRLVVADLRDRLADRRELVGRHA